ncbi:dTDP-glucose 4,6-dehydratase [Rhizobium viscosum]|uniref:dTDP-glucose 4,6-dehydratase n=1 Tax=Rhizobium viscosum TaxID=1673 RepID=A0ABR9IZM0_RHIVS|nr:dTDP-glucose 4,6-dehydratase [Rhizobium viscosum]MBE1508581.1 dTDP-glucose 4,6-dehydratase [Rhizobium viscosum]
MTILITGGAGFIGSNFALDWVRTSVEQIVNVDKLTYAGNLSNLDSLRDNHNHVFVRADINDYSVVLNLLQTYKVRAILNFAAESHVDRSIHGPRDFIETNIVGTFNLLEAARAYWGELAEPERQKFRFLHVSTDEVYGTLTAAQPAFTEMNQYQPNSPYAASKAASDHLVRAYCHTYGLPVITTNCSNNYGPYQFPEKLIPLTIHRALSGKELPVYGDGQQVRDWLYVKDHCSALRRVLEVGAVGEVYNIGGNNEKTNLDVVKVICALLDELKPRADRQLYELRVAFVADRPGHDRRYAIDATKLATQISWQPDETFESGIRKTVEWYMGNQAWTEAIVNGEYRTWLEKQYGNTLS